MATSLSSLVFMGSGLRPSACPGMTAWFPTNLRCLPFHQRQTRIAGAVLDLDQPEIAVETQLARDAVLDRKRV